MTLAKIEGVNGEVFIPDQINEQDKLFLIRSTENIVTIVSKSKIDIGLELMAVEQYFRESNEFGGPNGWYMKWCESLGINQKMKSLMTNRVKLVLRTNADEELVSNLPTRIASKLGTPTMLGNSNAISGASIPLAKYVVSTEKGELDGSLISELQNTPINQLIGGEELLAEKKELLSKAVERSKSLGGCEKKEADRIHASVKTQKLSIAKLEEKLSALEQEKRKLEIKYEDYQSPEAIKQEFDEAIANARADEKAKKGTTIDPVVAKKLTDKDLEIESLKKQLKEADDEWAVEEHLNTVLHKVLPDSARCLDLKQQVELATKQFDGLRKQVVDAQDIQKVTPKNLEHRVELVNMCASEWHELAITYVQAKRVCTDEDMIARAEDGITKSWQAWIERLPLDTVSELMEMLESRLNHQNMSAAKPGLVTIDV